MTQPRPFTTADYRATLSHAKDQGWRFISFQQGSGYSGNDRLCLLRHDCDNDLVASLRLARIEAEEGISATYFVMLRSALYNLLAPDSVALMNEILALGHTLGLHFDEMPFMGSGSDALIAQIDRERQILGDEFGVPVEVVSFHQPGPRILENRIRLQCLNTYDKSVFGNFHYMSDSNLRADGAAFRDAFATQNRPMQILTHPEWWTTEDLTAERKWNLMLANMLERAQDSLLRREKIFHRLRKVRIE